MYGDSLFYINQLYWGKMKNIVAIVLAGGQGERLSPLTENRAKPAVPFGGGYRIIDFTLSNCVNSNLRKIFALTQYKSISLHRHMRQAWGMLPNMLGEYLEVIPPQQRIAQNWYQGTADAVYQNLYTFEGENCSYFIILSGDHIYKMDYSFMYKFHMEHNAEVTICCIELDKGESRQFGVVEVDAHNRVLGFQEKPADPKVIPTQPDKIFASMGIYIFNRQILFDCLKADSEVQDSSHDFGKDILPRLVAAGRKVYAYSFHDENRKHEKYWKDVGTIDAYYDANMDLVSIEPHLNLYDQTWPIFTFHGQSPSAKTVHSSDGGNRVGMVIESIICSGCIISGGKVFRSLLSPDVRVNSYSEVSNSILFNRVNIGRHCRIRRAIIDKDLQIPPYTEIGFNLEEDKKRFTVTPSGITIVSAGKFETSKLDQEKKLIYS